MAKKASRKSAKKNKSPAKPVRRIEKTTKTTGRSRKTATKNGQSSVKKKVVRNPANKTSVKPKKQKLVTIKTAQNSASVEGFINKVGDAQKVKDSFAIVDLMKKVSGAEPKMWGTSIIGFGNKVYVSPATGRSVDWMLIGFSPRKANLTLYLMNMSEHADRLKKLGKHKIGGGCLYINKLEDIDMKVLKEMIEIAFRKNK